MTIPRGCHEILVVLVVSAAVTLGSCSPDPAGHSSASNPVGEETGEKRAPNILLINIDALRGDHLGFAGYQRPVSPFLDQLASRSVSCRVGLSHGSQTFLSTAALLTSMSPPPVVATSSGTERRSSLVPISETLPGAFASAGYETFAVLTNPHMADGSGYPELFEVAQLELDSHREEGRRKKIAYAKGETVVRAFEAWTQRDPPQRPWFAYLHFMDVHNPYWPPREFREMFVGAKGVDRYRNGVPPERVSETDLQYMVDLYDAGIRYVDSLVERVVQLAETSSERFVVVVTGDHGDLFLEHGRLGHGKGLEPELVKVPLLYHRSWEPTGVVEDGLCPQVDIAPVLAAIAEVPAEKAWDGQCGVRSICDGTSRQGGTRVSYSSYGGLMAVSSLSPEPRHVVWDTRVGSKTTYNLLNGELVSGEPAGAAEHLETIDRLRKERRGLASKLRDVATMPDEVREQLEALGYVDED